MKVITLAESGFVKLERRGSGEYVVRRNGRISYKSFDELGAWQDYRIQTEPLTED